MIQRLTHTTIGIESDLSIQVKHIPEGDSGVYKTIDNMQKIVGQAVYDPLVIHTAQNIVLHVDEYDQQGELNAIHSWVQSHFRYTLDPYDSYKQEEVELVKNRVSWILQQIQKYGKVAADCDDASVLEASLISAIGIPTRFKTVGRIDTQYSHVYLEAQIKTNQGIQWIPLDPIKKSQLAGWEIQGTLKKKSIVQ